MLTSVVISKRQSKIREELAGLTGKEKPDENELRAMGELETEYSANERGSEVRLSPRTRNEKRRKERSKPAITLDGAIWSAVSRYGKSFKPSLKRAGN
jgi:hypothetical protein